MCLKESFFPDCWKLSPVVPIFKNVGKRSTAKNNHPVGLVNHLKKCALFPDFQYGFRSFLSTADPVTVVSD